MSASWGVRWERRREVRARWRTVFDVPIVPRASDLVVERCPAAGGRVLEVGAGERRIGKRLAAERPGCDYRTVDVDPLGAHDYRSVEDAEGLFHVVALLEVIEHLALEEGTALLRAAAARLAPSGRVVVGTPNVHCPGRFLSDATHRTPYAHDELGALVLLAGLRLEAMYRTHATTALGTLGRALMTPLHRALGVDFATSVVAVGSLR